MTALIITLTSHVSGQVVDQDALVKALQSGTIRAAALDVTHPEPLPRSRLSDRSKPESHPQARAMHHCDITPNSSSSSSLCRGHPLLSLSNVLITPHIGISTTNTASRIVEKMVENAVAAVKGLPVPNEVKSQTQPV